MRDETTERPTRAAGSPDQDAPSRDSSWWNRPIAVGLAALLLASIFAVLRLESYEWNPTGFVHAGGKFVDPEQAPPGLLIRPDEIGFDGAAYYRLALNPFTRDRIAHGMPLDLPAFRHARIGYPLIVWAVSGGGRPSVVGWAMVLVNVAGLAAIGWLGGSLAVALGRRALWGILLPLYPGFVLSLGLDTAEIVAAAFACAGILMLIRNRYGPATLLLTVAMFVRETTMLVAIGVGIAWLLSRLRADKETSIPAHVFVVPGAAYVAWQIFLRAWWGHVPLGQGSDVDVAAPFWGLVVAARGWPETDGTQAAYHVMLVIAMVTFIGAAGWVAWRHRRPAFAVFGFAAAAALAVLWSEAIWLHHWGFLRAFVEAYLLAAVVLLASRVDLRRYVIGAATIWTSLVVNLVLHP